MTYDDAGECCAESVVLGADGAAFDVEVVVGRSIAAAARALHCLRCLPSGMSRAGGCIVGGVAVVFLSQKFIGLGLFELEAL